MILPLCTAALTLAQLPCAQSAMIPVPAAQTSGAPILDTVAVPAAQAAAPAAAIDSAPELPSAADAMTSPDAAMADDIVVTMRRRIAADPLEGANIEIYRMTESVDTAVIGPVALGFERIVPTPIRTGLRNALNNLREPDVFINFIIQHRIGKAFETLARFVINSTVGLAGLFDVARQAPFHLPHRLNGFADSMGFYGVPTGAYLFLPIIGPTTVRDLGGFVLDRLFLPLSVGTPFNQLAYTIPTSAVHTLDDRAEFDVQLSAIRAQSADPYAARRDFYLRSREAEIAALHGRSGAAISPVASSPVAMPPEVPAALPR